MRRLRWATFLVAAVVVGSWLPSTSEATPIGPSCGTCQGSIYELSYSGAPIATTATTETFRITYTIDTSGYTGVGDVIDSVALKVASSFVDATLISAPGGAAQWVEMSGGLNAAGCSDSGSGYDCVRFAATLALAPAVPGGTYTWVFDIEVPTGALFTGLDQASVKARYMRLLSSTTGIKAGALVSEGITLTNLPEPSAALLLVAALAAWRGRPRTAR
jgi:hypothetical protein